MPLSITCSGFEWIFLKRPFVSNVSVGDGANVMTNLLSIEIIDYVCIFTDWLILRKVVAGVHKHSL